MTQVALGRTTPELVLDDLGVVMRPTRFRSLIIMAALRCRSDSGRVALVLSASYTSRTMRAKLLNPSLRRSTARLPAATTVGARCPVGLGGAVPDLVRARLAKSTLRPSSPPSRRNQP